MSINPLYGVRGSFTQGELEGAKPASNQIKCRAKPCLARRAWSEATIFVPQGGTKITTLFQAVEKSRRLFRQPGAGLCPARFLLPPLQREAGRACGRGERIPTPVCGLARNDTAGAVCGAMHPKGACSASLHCVGIAPYGNKHRKTVCRGGCPHPPERTIPPAACGRHLEEMVT